MAYFHKRGQKWYFTIDVGKKPDGSRDQKKVGGFKTKKEASLAAAEMEQDLANGTYIEEQDTTLKQFVDEWIDLYGDEVKESSVRVRKHESARLMKHLGEQVQLKDITPKMYQKALRALKKEGYAENTLAGIHGTGRMIFQKAVELRVIKIDPTQYAKVPRVKKTVEELEQEQEIPKYLEKEELSCFLKTAKEKGLEGDYAIFLTLAYTGMRGGELCALKWSDVDFEANTISITKTYYNPTNNIQKYKLQTPKTDSSKRVIEVDPAVPSELKPLQDRQDKIKAKDPNYHVGNFVFTVQKYPGYPIYIKLIEGRMARLLKLAGLTEELTPHSLRHTHTSLLAEAGVGLEEIMERLGHSDDEITRKVYLHVTKTKKKEAAQKFSELMSNL